MKFTHTQVLSIAAAGTALAGIALAIVHKSGIDFYILVCEWLLCGILAALLYVLYRRSTPLCHIIFVRRKSTGFIAVTEYHRHAQAAGHALAAAIAKAQRDPYCYSITYYETGKDPQYIHIRDEIASEPRPAPPRRACLMCQEDAWYWNGSKYQCRVCNPPE